MGYVICVRGRNGKKFYAKKLRKRIVETSSFLSDAIVFSSIEQLLSEYRDSQGKDCNLDLQEDYITPYIIKV